MQTVGSIMDDHLKDLSTKRKEAKEKTEVKKSIDYSTIGKITHKPYNSKTDSNMSKEQMEQQELDDLERSKRQLRDAEIDKFLDSLIRDGMLNEDYRKWVAKAIYMLGLKEVNDIRIQSLNGKSPQHLFVFKLKGAMEYKRRWN